MLTLCRTLMGNHALIMIEEEPTEGLAPKIVELVQRHAGGAARRRLGARGVARGVNADATAAGRCGPAPTVLHRRYQPTL